MPVPDVTSNQALTSSWLDTNYSNQVVSTVLAAGKPAGTEGQVIAVTDTDRLEIYTGSAWSRVRHYSSAGRTGCTIRRVATQSIANTTDTAISFDTEDFDSDGWFAPTSDTITVPSGLDGDISITAYVAWASSPGANSNARFVFSGTSFDFRNSVGSSSVGYQSQGVSVANWAVAATNTIKLQVYQSSGGAINVTASLQLRWLGP